MTKQEAEYIREKLDELMNFTSFHDVESATQNTKTDVFGDDPGISFKDWLEEVLKTFLREYKEALGITKEITYEDLILAILSDESFMQALKDEYEELKELCVEDEDDYEEDEEDDDIIE